MADTRINGKYRNYSSVRVSAWGDTFDGLLAINYKRADSIDPVRGLGTTKPIGHTQGQETFEGSVTMTSELLDRIQRSLPAGKTLPDMAPTPISISYVDDNNIQVSHTLLGVKFKENGRSADSGSNDALSQEIPLYIHDIDFAA